MDKSKSTLKQVKSIESVAKEIIVQIKKFKTTNQVQLNKIKLGIARKYHLKQIPNNVELSNYASKEDRALFKTLLTIKPVRTMSGVAPIAIMTKPHKCPHGKCTYCPGGVDSAFGDVPQSYTGKEPATRRAIRNLYDPYLQVMNRLEQYVVMNKVPDKAELIIMGGTFPSLPIEYQDEFIMFVFKALNDFSKLFYKKGELDFEKFNKVFEVKKDIDSEERLARIHARLLKEKNKNKKSLEKEQTINETSKLRCVALTIETRPDYCGKKEINQLLKLGCTRVELGVQTIYDNVLKKIERGHTVQESINATKLLKDSCFKINYHIMPGLPGSDKKKDIHFFNELFDNQNFKPDMLKIYPCMVMKGTKLYNVYKKGKFKPITTEQAADLIIELKKIVPKYVRIMRVQRDIPTAVTEAGVDRTNLRQYIEQLMKTKKVKCKCIRCREIKDRQIKGKIKFKEMHYEASGGLEFFISAEADDSILGFCRLRIPSESFRKEITKDSVLIRELHVFGEASSIGKNEKGKTQHKGIGKKMMEITETIARAYYKNKIVVISGVGVRGYYKKIGYKKEGPYMTKILK